MAFTAPLHLKWVMQFDCMADSPPACKLGTCETGGVGNLYIIHSYEPQSNGRYEKFVFFAAEEQESSYAHQSIKHHQSCEVSKNLLPKLTQDVYLAEWGSKSSSDSVFLCFIVVILLFWSVLRARFWHHRHLVCNKTAWFLQRATKNVFGKDIKNIRLQRIWFEKCAFIQ